MTDPQLIVHRLSLTKEMLNRWLAHILTTYEEINYQSKLTYEKFFQVETKQNIIQTQIDTDVNNHDVMKSSTTHIKADVHNLHNEIGNEHKLIQETLDEAEDILEYWQKELFVAKAWLKQAQAWKRSAEEKLETAKIQLDHAHRELNFATKALNDCKNNRNRNNCNSEVAYFVKAKERVAFCETCVEKALAELEMSIAEITKAKQQINRCELGKSISIDAVENCKDAMVDIKIADEFSEQNFIELSSLAEILSEKERLIKISIEDIEQIQVDFQKANREFESSRVTFKKMEEFIDDSKLYVHQANAIIDEKLTDLIEFDRVYSVAGSLVPPTYLPQQNLSNVNNEIADPLMIALPFLLSSIVGTLNFEIGKIGEKLAAKVLHQDQNITILKISNGKGVDIIGLDQKRNLVCVEVKTSKSKKEFSTFLKYGYGYRQMSDGWLKSNKIDPDSTLLLGILVDPEKNTFKLYKRSDQEANDWKCIKAETKIMG